MVLLPAAPPCRRYVTERGVSVMGEGGGGGGGGGGGLRATRRWLASHTIRTYPSDPAGARVEELGLKGALGEGAREEGEGRGIRAI